MPFRFLLLAIVILVAYFTFRVLTLGATFTVNYTDDLDDGTCDEVHCSLREALTAANDASGLDTIVFNIPGPGPHTIQPGSALPLVTEPVILDGTSQPGYEGAPIIELDGTLAGVNATGISIASGNSTVRGMIISRFSGSGIGLENRNGNLIESNYLGTNATGMVALANGDSGVFIANGSSYNTIGGSTAPARNLISGNGSSGITMQGDGVSWNLVQGNYIGTDATGTADLGNGSDGIHISEARNNIIGGTASSTANTIAFNGISGVAIAAGTGNAILTNNIFSNKGPGIDLGADGVTLNDSADGDTGANNLQNSPTVMSAEISKGGELTVQYSVDSEPASSAYPLLIEIFLADVDGEEGKALLGSDSYPTSSARSVKVANLGDATGLGVANGDRIVATATDAENNTSEFPASGSVTVAPTGTPSATPSSTPPDATPISAETLVEEGEEAGEALAEAAEADPEGAGITVAAAAEEDAESTGKAIARAAVADAGSTGRAIASAAVADAGSTGRAIASAALTDAGSTGRAIASAAAEDAEATGEAVASAAAADAVATGEALARAAEEDPESTGAALTTSVRTNARAIGRAMQTSARENAGATGEALNRGPARVVDTLADLGEVIPVEPFVEEVAPQPGPDPTGVGVWQAVGSPAPIERILARYARTFPQAKVVVRDVPQLPAGVPSLPSDSILNSMMELEVEGFENEDVVAVHTSLFVERSWLEANQVHQWSVQFNRFDSDEQTWRPVPAKRVREDQERVYFSVVIPGFSLWAITGSMDVPEVEFFVDELTITPSEAKEGEPVTIGVKVTDLSSSETVYTASLWLNSRVDTVQLVSMGANETVPVTFAVRPEVGSYDVRVDRLRGILVVRAAATPEVVEEVEPEPGRGAGLFIGAIVGVLAVAAIVGTIFTMMRRRRKPELPPPPAGPPAGSWAPEASEEEPPPPPTGPLVESGLLQVSEEEPPPPSAGPPAGSGLSEASEEEPSPPSVGPPAEREAPEGSEEEPPLVVEDEGGEE